MFMSPSLSFVVILKLSLFVFSASLSVVVCSLEFVFSNKSIMLLEILSFLLLFVSSSVGFKVSSFLTNLSLSLEFSLLFFTSLFPESSPCRGRPSHMVRFPHAGLFSVLLTAASA